MRTYPSAFAVLAMVLLGIGSRLAPAQETPDNPDEGEFLPMLFLSNHPLPQDKGELSLSLDGDYFSSRNGRDGDVGFSIEYGVTDRLTVELELPYLLSDPSETASSQGFGDVGFNVMYNFFRSPKTLLSAYMEFHIPTGGDNGELTTNSLEWEPALLAAHHFGSVEIDASIGGAFAQGESPEVTYSIAGSTPIGPVIGVVEFSGFSGDETSCYLTPGVVWVRGELEIGLGVPIGLTSASEGWGLRMEVTYSFP